MMHALPDNIVMSKKTKTVNPAQTESDLRFLAGSVHLLAAIVSESCPDFKIMCDEICEEIVERFSDDDPSCQLLFDIRATTEKDQTNEAG